MTPGEFAARWRGVETSERASAQSHFLDLCALLHEPGPTTADPTGTWYAFEKGAGKLTGGDGFADVWKRGFFAWEYKGKRKDLRAAYLQLQGYRDALENPPLLVVSDLDRIEVRTNFTGLSPITKIVTLDDLAAADPSEATASCVGITKAVLLMTDGRIGPAFDSNVREQISAGRPETCAAWVEILEGVAEDIAAFESRNGPLRKAVSPPFAHLAYGRLYDMALGPRPRSRHGALRRSGIGRLGGPPTNDPPVVATDVQGRSAEIRRRGLGSSSAARDRASSGRARDGHSCRTGC